MNKSVNILGLTYEVESVPVVSKDEFLAGRIDFLEQKIYIDNSVKPEREAVVLLHEVIHGILCGLAFHEENQKEEMVQGLATGLYQFLSARGLTI